MTYAERIAALETLLTSPSLSEEDKADVRAALAIERESAAACDMRPAHVRDLCIACDAKTIDGAQFCESCYA